MCEIIGFDLELIDTLRSLAGTIHMHLIERMRINSKTYFISFKIINRVEMTQEKISDEVNVAFSAWTKFCFVNYKEACVLSGFEEVFFRV